MIKKNKSAKLYHKNKLILSNMKYATSIFEIGKGLMFASKNKIDKGICLVMPTRKNRKYSCAITMYFCFYPMDILFINSDLKIVDKVTLNPWKSTYIPKNPCKYVIESSKDKFKDIKINDTIKIKF